MKNGYSNGSNGSNGSVDGEADDLQLNGRALEVANELIDLEDGGSVIVHEIEDTCVVDVGVEAYGSLVAGRYLAEISMADLGSCVVQLDRLAGRPCPKVMVETESATAACLLSQYAGWKLVDKDFFAMASGPIRALVREEELFDKLKYHEKSEVAVAVLESSTLPTARTLKKMARMANVTTENLVVVVARTASLAGGVQVSARCVETCLHKLHELGFDIDAVRCAAGSAFVPPVPADDLTAIGRTNDSILYGSEVLLWVDAADDDIHRVGAKLPSNSSPEYGKPFREIFDAAGGDFYKIDPALFSPAKVFINNLRTGSTFLFGETNDELVARSFFGV